jgi:hypothetical protein
MLVTGAGKSKASGELLPTVTNSRRAAVKGPLTRAEPPARILLECGAGVALAKPGITAISERLAAGRQDSFATLLGELIFAIFTYSSAFLRARDNGVIWTPETLLSFLSDPHNYVPGNRLRYASITDPEQRRRVIARLIEATR